MAQFLNPKASFIIAVHSYKMFLEFILKRLAWLWSKILKKNAIFVIFDIDKQYHCHRSLSMTSYSLTGIILKCWSDEKSSLKSLHTLKWTSVVFKVYYAGDLQKF